MPRVSRATATALAVANSDNDTVVARKRKMAAASKGVVEKKNVEGSKGNKRRAVLGEITNALVEASRREAKKVWTNTLGTGHNSNASGQQSSFKYSIKQQAKVEELENEEEVPKSVEEKQVEEIKESKRDSKVESDVEKVNNVETSTDTPLVIASNTSSKEVPVVVDFDQTNLDDPFQVAEYAPDIFNYYKSRESSFVIPDYMTQGVQPEISVHMRAILVDWLVEVQESFELNHETLYTAVKILDLYLSKKAVRKDQLQLYGAVSVLIACKIDERLPPLLDDFVYVCDDAYSKQQIITTEITILDTIGFDLGYPLTYRFLRRFGRVCGVNMEILTLARFVLELSLMEYSLNVETSESKLAASALMLALRLKGIEDWETQLSHYSGYEIEDCAELVKKLLAMVKENREQQVKKTIRTKYSHRVFHEVAQVSLPDSINW